MINIPQEKYSSNFLSVSLTNSKLSLSLSICVCLSVWLSLSLSLSLSLCALHFTHSRLKLNLSYKSILLKHAKYATNKSGTYMAETSTAWQYGDLMQRCGIFSEICHQRVACFMVGSHQVCLLVRNFVLLRWTC